MKAQSPGDTAPNLASSSGTASDISQNFITGISDSAAVVGHLTGTQTERELMLDVTSFVRDHPDQQISFLIAREVRYDGENVADELTSLRLAAKESANDAGPQLLLSLNEAALAADFNRDGVVDAADLAAWHANVGSGASTLGDADADQDVDGADLLAWQRQLGGQLTATINSVAIPEPAGVRLGIQTACCLLFIRLLF
ncbi:MAG TPA: hypothetical protein VF175_12470 [Lacipirellula sp.]